VNLDEMAVRVRPGDGLIARFPTAVVVVATPARRLRAVGDEVLTLARETLAPGGPAGRRLARQLAALVAQAEPDDVPPFCALAESEDGGLALFAVGDVDVELHGPGGSERWSGRDVSAWIDRIVREPFDTLSVVPAGEATGGIDERTDLRSGVVPGDGFALVAAVAAVAGGREAPAAAAAAAEALAAPAPKARAPKARARAKAPARARPAAPAPPPEPVEPVEAAGEGGDRTSEVAVEPGAPVEPPVEVHDDFKAVLLFEPEPEPDGPRPPLEVAGQAPPPAAEAAAPEGTVVDGVVCSRGHFNDPDGSYCSVCGISLLQRTRHLVQGVRPPLGVVVFDDGATFALDRDYVVGRDPSQDEGVTAGRARPLVVDDPGRTVSRVHAALVLEGWEVKLVDRRSANGTFVAAPNTKEWGEAIPPLSPVTIRPGTRVRLGDQREFLFDSPHRS
jgi:hypothetical protein